MFPPRRTGGWLLAVTLLLLPSGLVAAAQETDLRTGRALVEGLQSRRALTVQAIPLRQLLADLQVQTGICIVLDRRIDPSQRLTMNVELSSTLELLQAVAEQIPDAGFSVNRSFVYIAPSVAARRLRTLCEQNRTAVLEVRRQLDPEVYGRLSARMDVLWEELARPRDVIQRAAESQGLQVTNPEVVPADLWHAGRLAAMSFSEAATLLLNQFDLTFRLDAADAALQIVAVPESVVIEQRHSVPRRRRGQVELQLKEQFSDIVMRWERASVYVQATWEQHQQIAALVSGSGSSDDGTPTESLKTRLFTLTLPDGITWRNLIRQLQESGVSIRIEGSIEGELDNTVSVSLNRLPGREFFPRLFADLSVTVDVRDSEVVLRAKNPDR